MCINVDFLFKSEMKRKKNERWSLVNSNPKRIMDEKNSTVNVSINKNNEHPNISLEIMFFTSLLNKMRT